jgi:hypothetical protein
MRAARRQGSTIHVYNKNEVAVRDHLTHDVVDRRSVLLMGDSLGRFTRMALA